MNDVSVGAMNETQWQYLANAMPQLVWIAEANGQVSYYNDRVSEYFGAELVNGVWTWEGMIHPEDIELTNKAWSTAVSQGSVYEISHRVRMKDGSFRWHLSRALSEKNTDGKVTRWYGTATDIHQQKLYEEKIRENEERLSRIFRQTSVGIAQCELDGRIVMVNDRFCEITARSTDELLALSIFEITHPDDRPANAGLVQALIAQGQPYKMEKRYIRPDGSYVWVFVDVATIKDSAGNPKNLLGICQDISEQKNAQIRLTESEERFRIMAESAPNMVWSINPDGSLKFVNQYTLDYFGVSAQDFASDRILSHIHEEDRDSSSEKIITAVRNGGAYRLEHRLRRADGEYRWFLSQGGPSTHPDGIRHGFVGSGIDIHDRKRFEEELRYQSQLNKTITDNTSVPLFMMDSKGVCTFINPAAEKTFGFAIGELRDKPLHDYIHHIRPDGSPFPMHDCPIVKSVTGGKDLREQEDVFVSKDGRLIHVMCAAKQIIKDGQTIGVLLEARDVTAEKEANDALKESEERFRSIADNISQLAWMVDPQGKIIWFNKRWVEFTGIEAHETANRKWASIHPEYVARVMEKFEKCIAHGEPWEDTFPLKNREGYYRWFLSRATPIRDSNGIVLRWFGTNTDITERKETEEAIRMMANNLEKLVVERTLALQRSNDDLQQFAHVASHDLKEPLRKIQTFSNRLMDEFAGSVGEKGAVYLGKIAQATRRMFNMIEGVLNYSTVNATTQRPGPVDLNEVLQHIESDLEILIEEKGATVKYDQLPIVEGAGVLIYQLFYNLVNNSLKFSRPTVPPVIRLEEELIPENPRWVRIIVTDNGIGFEQEYAEKIFHTFTRLNSKDKFEGTGLGLALCKKIVELHNGSIHAVGSMDQGARFVIQLPRTSVGV